MAEDIVARFEDVVYGETFEVANEPNADAYRESLIAFDRARILKELPELPAYQELMKVLEETAQRYAEAERSYQGIDRVKTEKLRLERIKADSTLSTIRGIVAEASTVPLPRFAV